MKKADTRSWVGAGLGVPLCLNCRGAGTGLPRLDHLEAGEPCASWGAGTGVLQPLGQTEMTRLAEGAEKVEVERLHISCSWLTAQR